MTQTPRKVLKTLAHVVVLVCTRSRPVSTCLTAIVVLSSTTRSVTPPR